jgi:hypothetical protein
MGEEQGGSGARGPDDDNHPLAIVLIHPGGLDAIDPEKLFNDFAGLK